VKHPLRPEIRHHRLKTGTRLEVPFEPAHFPRDVHQALGITARSAEKTHVVAVPQQPAHEIGTDETGPAGD